MQNILHYIFSGKSDLNLWSYTNKNIGRDLLGTSHVNTPNNNINRRNGSREQEGSLERSKKLFRTRRQTNEEDKLNLIHHKGYEKGIERDQDHDSLTKARIIRVRRGDSQNISF